MIRADFIRLSLAVPAAFGLSWHEHHLTTFPVPWQGKATADSLAENSRRFAGAMWFESDGPDAVTWRGGPLGLLGRTVEIEPGRLHMPTSHIYAICYEDVAGRVVLAVARAHESRALYLPAVGTLRFVEAP